MQSARFDQNTGRKKSILSLCRFAVYAFFALGLISLSGCWLSRKLIYAGDQNRALPAVSGGSLIKTRNGSRDAFGFLTKRGPMLVVALHGNGTALHTDSGLALRLARQGFSSLLVEYPGYGHASAYDPSESAIYSDSQALVEYVQKEYGYKKSNTTLWGYSLGTGVATQLATRGLGRSLVLVSPYTSIPDVAEVHYVVWLPHLLIWDRFNTLGRASDIKQPVLIFHGVRDKTIPIAQGREVHAELPHSNMVELPRAGHNGVYRHFSLSHWDRAYALIRSGSLP